MIYTVTGLGINDAPLSYEKETLGDAGYLADKMADNGVRNVLIQDADGLPITLEEALKAHRDKRRPRSIARQVCKLLNRRDNIESAH